MVIWRRYRNLLKLFIQNYWGLYWYVSHVNSGCCGMKEEIITPIKFMTFPAASFMRTSPAVLSSTHTSCSLEAQLFVQFVSLSATVLSLQLVWQEVSKGLKDYPAWCCSWDMPVRHDKNEKCNCSFWPAPITSQKTV